MPAKPLVIKSMTNTSTGEVYVLLADIIRWVEKSKNDKRTSDENKIMDEIIGGLEKLEEKPHK